MIFKIETLKLEETEPAIMLLGIFLMNIMGIYFGF